MLVGLTSYSQSYPIAKTIGKDSVVIIDIKQAEQINRSHIKLNNTIDNTLYDLFSRYRNEIKKFKIDDWFVFNDKGNRNMTYQELATLYSTFGTIINRKISIASKGISKN